MHDRKIPPSLLLTLSAIWFLGPYIAIGGKILFATLNSRFIASLSILLFFFSMHHYRKGTFFSDPPLLPEALSQELKALQKAIKNIMQNLHGNFLQALLFKYRKPWYLVLGPLNAGKRTFLNKADLNIKGQDHLAPMMVAPSKFLNWWLADEAVFIDIGGRYLREQETTDHNETLLQGFFKLLKRYRAYKPINGLILTINLQELTVNIKEQSQLKKLQHIVNELVLQFINFPIYLIITRCDTIEGFAEFFEDLGPDERNQIFGMTFPLTPQPESLPQLFNDQYNALLTRLHQRVIWRLHKEHSADKAGKIKNFPLQMEFLKNPLAKLLNLILPHTSLNLRGIFFTSAFQKDTPIDNLTKALSHAYDIHHLHQSHRSMPSKSFFIKEIFKRIIFPESRFYSVVTPNKRFYLLTSCLIILITSLCLFFFYSSYRYSLATIKNTQQALNNAIKQPTTITPLLHQLDILHTIITQLNNRHSPWYAHIGMQQTQQLKSTAEKKYATLLTTQFLTYLQHTLEIQLQNVQEDHSTELYATLKAYLMLGNHAHLNKRFLLTWFNNYWHQLDQHPIHQHNLSQHLSALFQHGFKEQSLNKPLIDSKRAVLNTIPPPRLALALLQNQYPPLPIMPASQATILGNLPIEIPGIYAIVNFRNIYYVQIAKTCQETAHGDWVLGKRPSLTFSDIEFNQLLNDVRAIYLNEYAIMWSGVLDKIKMNTYQNLEQIVAMLDLLNNPQSPLIQLINTIRNNTQPLSDSLDFTQQVSSRFMSLNTLSADFLKNTSQLSLSTLKQYLNNINHAPDSDRASYEAAKNRMEHQDSQDAITTLLQQARLLPEPLQTWHTMLAVESWRIILRNTQTYLNRIWSATVYPQYKTVLDQRYPLFKEAAMDASLSDFTSFFKENGIMDTFFKNYLQPFVDNSRLYWEWKNIDGQRIAIPQPTLEMFIRAALIQKMFFPEGASAPSISFSLVPVDLDPTIQSFNLNLEGQLLTFQKDNEQIISLTWPGPQLNHSEIAFIDQQGKKSVLSETGPWSWFKILDKSHLESTNNPKHFKLTFDLNGALVHYELYANGIVNPFLAGILNAFRCPEIL